MPERTNATPQMKEDKTIISVFKREQTIELLLAEVFCDFEIFKSK
jgi:hypothetical protein